MSSSAAVFTLSSGNNKQTPHTPPPTPPQINPTVTGAATCKPARVRGRPRPALLHDTAFDAFAWLLQQLNPPGRLRGQDEIHSVARALLQLTASLLPGLWQCMHTCTPTSVHFVTRRHRHPSTSSSCSIDSIPAAHSCRKVTFVSCLACYVVSFES